MFCRRIGRVVLTLGVTFTILSCSDATNPLDPVGPQYAKGGIPGKPTESAPVELLEYFVFEDTDGDNFVHILAKGTFPRANLNVVQDYFHDGIRNNNLFYEYTTAYPPPVGEDALPEGAVWQWDSESEAWHIDIPWNGETHYRIYPDPDDPDSPPIQTIETTFPDFPHFELPGGGDPFSFDLRFQKENGDYIDSYRPKGIILEGSEIGATTTVVDAGHAYHTGETVHSFASYESTRPGNGVSIEDIILDESSLTCELTKTRTGRGKNKVTQTVTEVTARAQIILSPGGPGEEIAPGWITVMFASGDPDNPTLHDTFQSTHGSDAWASGWGAGAQIPGDLTAEEFRFAVVYVYATDLENGDVYDPGQNQGAWDSGSDAPWFTISPNIVQDDLEGPLLESFPIAMTAPLNLNCGN